MQKKYFVLDFKKLKEQFAQNSGNISPFDAGIPLLELSDEILEKIYYFRFHTYCKQIKETPEGYVVTEFLPDVPWAGKYNTINCPAGHHFYEGRWLHSQKYLTDYAKFWFTEFAEPRKYSFWAADAIFAFCKVSGDFSLVESLLECLKKNYSKWETTNLKENGLFYQIDDRDGMEYSISGNGMRPTINSYMCGDAKAISEIAKMAENTETCEIYEKKYNDLREKINDMLWDNDAEFFKNRSESSNYNLSDVREEIGYVPWYFNIPDDDKSCAWRFLNDEKYFAAPYGPTTAEQNHPEFMKEFDHECLWNGPSWPFATSQTLTAMGNLLNNYNQNIITKSDYFSLLKTYASSHFIKDESGEKVPFIDENLDPYTGEWIARKLLFEMADPPGGAERGKDYNHSSFCDLILSGLVGIRANNQDILEINPLFSSKDLDYLCADGILYHGHYITVIWDKEGSRYGFGKGLNILCNGKKIAYSNTTSKIKICLSEV